MAYDKVVDSAVLDAGLKQIADAIREKGGTSGNLAFPAAMAEAIAAIESGGGVPMNIGTITPAAETNLLTVEHGLGKTPQNFMIMLTPGFSGTADKQLMRGYGFRADDSGFEFAFSLIAGRSGISSYGIVNEPDLIRNETVVAMPSESGWIAKKHTWIAVG